jgi:WD40 repeat protein
MTQLRQTFILVGMTLAVAGSLVGGTIYTTVNGASLATIDSATGIGSSSIGTFGGTNYWGLAFGPDGALYAANGTLATVNLSTGAATSKGSSDGISALAFAPNGTLYGAALFGNTLYTVNTTTGATTAVGAVGALGSTSLMDLAFDPLGNLYAVSSNGGASSILQISTTAGTILSTKSVNATGLMGLTFDASGNLYATNYTTDSTLYSINLIAGTATAVGGTGLVGFESHGLDINNFGSVPEPAAWIFIASGLPVFAGIR